MSFRARLLQTFLTLVIITTGAAMLIAQRQNEAMLQGVVNELFKAELKTFYQTQELSVEAAKAKGLHLAESVRLFAALEEGDPEEIYQVADAEMHSAGSISSDSSTRRASSYPGGLRPPRDLSQVKTSPRTCYLPR